MSLRTLKVIFGAVTVCFLLASTYIAVLVAERQKVLGDITHYNPAWHASQAVSEFMRLERRLDAFNVPGRGADKEEVELRFEILLSRAKLLIEGRLQSIIQDDPDQLATLRHFADVLALMRPLIAELEHPGAVQQALQLLEPLEPRLLQLASYAQIRGGERIAQDQQALNRLYWIFSGLSLGLILLGLILIGLFSRHNQLLERAHGDLHALTGRLAHAASHDALTKLANRALFHERLAVHLTRWQQKGIRFAALCLDLDRFKSVNDTLGHEIGDALLKVVADRLRNCLREGDTVARLGGDEFGILQEVTGEREPCTVLARRIVERLSAPYSVDGREIVIGASIGIAPVEADIVSPDQMLKRADLALYEAKSQGRGMFCYFEPSMEERLDARRSLEIDLRKALANDEFELFFQPQVNIKLNEINGFEALLRWHHPKWGKVSPAEFIPVAEEIGLISPLGEWVIQTACAEAVKWPRDIKVAVNLSPVQFRDGTLVQIVRNALEDTGLPPKRLELELTETSLLDENETTMAALHELRRLGVRIAIDDFGTGYSSLSYLRSFPFDRIKVDRTFVRDLSSRHDAMTIVRSIASLGAGLGMSTVAEGIETKEQLLQVQTAGYTEAQGYYFGRPKPAHELVYSLDLALAAPSA
ncbi:EAL domain-containing protein [Microvirga sp. 3-52]|uniref:putative bifunctional diguanylate cyclase/phosphodiesterase n=1 Tax=Microvirga sp. 3-52 TaxID=2792425 RepID=UPI001AD17B12|nr:EAL domain-containing protein [Microvirga sp. 3-52]MBO1907966.1 EAL domain-containing protein [Microvirga sp. 3-52]MBS7454783.1 EAL domain-containing protein [Microvirga sp. 3-52]